MFTGESLIRFIAFALGSITVILTLVSAVSTFVLPRAARSQLNRIVFGVLRRIFDFTLHFAKTYQQRDTIMAYYAPIGLLLLLPTWYLLILVGYAAMYWALGAGDPFAVVRLSGSSLFTLGFELSKTPPVTLLAFSEATLGLMLVGLLIAYLPTMYSAFARREQAVNMLEVRAGSPPSALEMLLRFQRNHGLEKLSEYWRIWEAWFADVEESHTTLPALIFFRSPRPENSWVTASGTILDAAAITLAAVDIPYEVSAALCIRAGFLTFRRIANYFDIPNPQNPHFPETPICVERYEFDQVLDQLAAGGVPLKPDREQAWRDFAGWRVNYDRSLILLCGLVMAPKAPWSSDRMPSFNLPPMFILKKKFTKEVGVKSWQSKLLYNRNQPRNSNLKGEKRMKDYFNIDTRTIVATGLGAAIFALLFMYVKIPSPVPETSFQTAYGLGAFFAALFGPIAGALIAFIGHALSDAIQYGSPWWSWVIASGVAGFAYGFAFKRTGVEEGTFGTKDIVTFNVIQVIGNVIAWILVAPVLDILIYQEPANLVFTQGVTAAIMNSISAGVIGTLLLLAYSATRTRKGSLSKA